MIYSRVNLAATRYQPQTVWDYITQPNLDELDRIYHTYCRYRQFASVMPLFANDYLDANTDIIGYRDHGQLVAFSLIRHLDQHNVYATQFAWTYHNPKLRLGIMSLQTECAIYRDRGFQYLYLGAADHYKQQIQGYETLGPL